jgi:prepilin-type N-terminal cleavage/methylation domain-containing protein
MDMQGNSANNTWRTDENDVGFTLIEILIAIVLVGILSAVAVVGISNLVSKGSTSACATSRDAAKAAATVYFVANANTHPTSFTQLMTVGASGAALSFPVGVTINSATSVAPAVPTGIVAGLQASSGSWYLTMNLVAGGSPTFSCSP